MIRNYFQKHILCILSWPLHDCACATTAFKYFQELLATAKKKVLTGARSLDRQIVQYLKHNDESLMLNEKLHKVSSNNQLCISASLKHKAFPVRKIIASCSSSMHECMPFMVEY